MGILKGHSHSPQSINIRGVNLARVTFRDPSPVIHVIDGDEENIGATLGAHDRDQKNNKRPEVNDSAHQKG